MFKLVVFVNIEAKEKLKEMLFKAGAGTLGQYEQCSFETEGMGQFLPRPGANPAIGTVKKLELVREVRIEMLVKEDRMQSVVDAIYEFHPYEEPAFDIIVLENHKYTKH